MCASLKDSPSFCKDYSYKHNETKNPHVTMYIIIAIASVFFISLIGLFIGRRYFNKKVNEQVMSKSVEVKIDNTVQNYLRLKLKTSDIN